MTLSYSPSPRIVSASLLTSAVALLLASPATAQQSATTATIETMNYRVVSVDSPHTRSTSNTGGTGSYSITYNGDQTVIDSFTTGSGANTTLYRPLEYTGNVRTTLVRTAPGTSEAPRATSTDLTYHQIASSSGNTYTVKGSYIPKEEDLFNSNNLFAGTDNLFTNTGNSSNNHNNIERVDVVFENGLIVTKELAFFIMERGGANAHEGFQIAAILAIDGAGTPTSFGDLLKIEHGSYGTTNFASGDWVVTRSPNAAPLTGATNYSTRVDSQGIGGTTIAVHDDENALTKDLGIAIGDTIYGYSIFALDVNPDDGSLYDVESGAYPKATTETNASGGGIDLVADTGVAVYAAPVPEPGTFAMMGIGAAALAFLQRRRKSRA